MEVRADRVVWLTRREAEVARLIGRGYSNREMAKLLFLSRKTIEQHKNKLYHKIGLHGLRDGHEGRATRWAMLQGLDKVTDEQILKGWEIKP